MSMQIAIELHIPTLSRGKRLRAAREDADLSQQQLADRTGISKRQIVYYENDVKEPDVGEYLLWQMITRAPVEWLEEGVVPSEPDPTGGTPGEVSGKLRFGNLQANVTRINFSRAEKIAA